MRLAVVATHPIQYQAPWFRHLARSMEIEVLYAHRQDASGQARAGFGVPFEWDTPLLDGYPYRWLKNVARSPGVDTFGGCDTPEVAELLEPQRFDACLVLGWNRKCFLQAAAACRRSRIPLFVRGDSQLRTPRSLARRLGKYFPYRLLLPRVGACLYVGQRNREYLRHYGVPDSKLFFCPHSVDNAFFAAAAQRARAQGLTMELRQHLGIGGSDFVMLFVGKFTKKKRPVDFIQACGELDATPSGRVVRGVLIGDGPLRHDLEEQAARWAGRIRFAGFRNQSEMPVWYAAADVLLLISEPAEAWGLVVNEAMACGLPAIVSEPCGCVPDLIEAGRTGHSVPVGDIETIMASLRRLDGQDPVELQRCLAEKMETYSFHRATQGVAAALESVC